MKESARILVLLQGFYEELATWLSKEWDGMRTGRPELPAYDAVLTDPSLANEYHEALIAAAKDMIEYASFGNAEAEVDAKLRALRDSLINSLAQADNS